MPYEHLQLSQAGPIATVTLNNPAQRNVLAFAVMRDLTQVLRDLAASDAMGVIVAAQGPVFSAGHDFADLLDATPAQAQALFSACTAMMEVVQAMPQPVVARVHALATAAGCQLVASCDLAVAAETATFALPGGKAGLFCHTPLVAVARNIGRKRALEMALTGDPIDAVTAADWGLINRVVPMAQLEPATLDLIQRATRGSALSKGLGKLGFYEQIDLPQSQAYAVSSQRMAQAALLPDAQEGIRAFLGKRRADYRQGPSTT